MGAARAHARGNRVSPRLPALPRPFPDPLTPHSTYPTHTPTLPHTSIYTLYPTGTSAGLGAIVGISIGGLVVLIAVAILGVCIVRRKKSGTSKRSGGNKNIGVEMGANMNNPMGADGRPLSYAPTTPRPKTPSTPRGALPAGWAATLDMSSGETYYYNQETGETQWEVPEHDKRVSALRGHQENAW